MSSLIGSKLEVKTDNTAITGLLMSVESMNVNLGDGNIVREFSHLSIMDDAAFAVTKIPLADLSSFRILDQSLQLDLMKALSANLQKRKGKPAPTGKTRIKVSF